ncbi:MAG: hypothetical protein M3450_02830 [Actinomycetota bacterium]|nr:hypothetical protein [Actinomycetota bacterium]
MVGAWRLLAGLLVVGVSGVLAALFIQKRQRVRYRLRNRLMPLTPLVDQPAPIERRVRWVIFGAVVVVILAVMAFGGSPSTQG